MLTATRDGIVVEDRGKIVYTNKAFAQMLGYESPEEVLGRIALDVVHPEDAERMAKFGEARLRGESAPSVSEFRAQRKDGSLIHGEASVSTSTVGGKTYILTAVRDIAERKQAEAALKEADQRAIRLYDQLLNRLATLAQALGSARDLTTVYRALCEFSIASAPVAGLAITIYYPEKKLREAVYFWTEAEGEVLPKDVPQIPVGDGPAGRAIKSGEIVVIDDYEKYTASRPVVWVGPVDHNVVRPALIAPMAIMGRVIGAVEIQNFTGNAYTGEHTTAMRMAASMAASAIENVRLLEHERQQKERLQQSQKMEAIGTLAGGVAHDFNNLLTVILGNIELAFHKLGPDDLVRHRLLEVDKAAKRASVLTRQLLAFSRRQQIERLTINLNDTIGEIMKLLHRIIGADIEVQVKAGANLSAIFADPAQIEQIVMNLAVNARDAMPSGGQLIIETSNVTLDESYQRQYAYVQPGSYVQMLVSDTGCGMDEQTKARIFEPFFTTKEVGKGTGLGLAMVYGIVKQHDGYINVYSEPEQGTTFKILLPVVQSQVETETKESQPVVKGGQETILVAEDEEALRNLASDVLEDLGYKVLLAKDGEEAVQLFTDNREDIDMLLFDVMMPRISGPQAYEKIRRLGGKMPLIFMTGYSSEIMASRFLEHYRAIQELGVVLIQKPYSVDGLGGKIREVLDGWATTSLSR
jgi:PAS domain S-box-containing protein